MKILYIKTCSDVHSRRFTVGLARDWNVCASYGHVQFTRNALQILLDKEISKAAEKSKGSECKKFVKRFVTFLDHLN